MLKFLLFFFIFTTYLVLYAQNWFKSHLIVAFSLDFYYFKKLINANIWRSNFLNVF